MHTRIPLSLAAIAVIAATGATACAGHGAAASHTGRARPASAARQAFDEGLSRVVNPSAAKGGTLTFDLSTNPDSTDYQNTSYLFMWDFVRLYSMQLMTYRSCPGACGLQLVPDLATAPGAVSDHGLIWTYHIRPDVRFQNGVTVTAQDVKYGIERTYARAELPYGPNYYQRLLQDPQYPGPYVDRGKNLMGLTSITTPNPTTIQFHLVAPFADFNYVAAIPQSTPVLPAWDVGRYGGAGFELNPISTGPYEFASYRPDSRLVLVRNPYWNPATDPQASQLASKIVVTMGVTPAAVDSDQLAGRTDLDLGGGGLQEPAVAQVLSTPALRADADNPLTGLLHFAYLNLVVIPDVHCRAAIEDAASKTDLLSAYGGATAGDIASAVLPPDIPGYQSFGGYDALTDAGGDDAAALAQLKLCGRPHGFTTGLAYRSDQPGDVQAARALRTSLAAVGIKVRLHGYLSASYYSSAGYPSYAVSHGLGITIGSWRAVWPDGYAFLDELSDGSAISYGGGNINIAQINDPSINALFAAAEQAGSQTGEAAPWARIDQKIMDLAAILPMVNQKTLLYRSPAVTNVYADDYYGMYNYAVLGVTPRS